MTTNERFLSVLHRITSCRHLATVNITIWNRRIEVRHTVFDEMYILRSFPLPNTHNEYCACMAAASAILRGGAPAGVWPTSCFHGQTSTTTATTF